MVAVGGRIVSQPERFCPFRGGRGGTSQGGTENRKTARGKMPWSGRSGQFGKTSIILTSTPILHEIPRARAIGSQLPRPPRPPSKTSPPSCGFRGPPRVVPLRPNRRSRHCRYPLSKRIYRKRDRTATASTATRRRRYRRRGPSSAVRQPRCRRWSCRHRSRCRTTPTPRVARVRGRCSRPSSPAR